MKKGRKHSTHLEELIHALEPKEKRYIALFLQQYKEKDTIYYKVFNLVSNQQKRTKKKSTIMQNQVIKVQLYWKILKALQLYHSESNPIIRKNNLLSQFQILSNKGLDHHSIRVLNTAKEVCLDNDLMDDVFFINKQETKILLEESQGQRNEDLISNFNSINLKQLKIIKQNYSLNKVYLQNKLNLNFFKPSLNETAYKISNSYSLNIKDDELLSNYGTILNNLNLGLYYIGIKEYKTALKHLDNSYHLYLKNTNLIVSYKDDFCELLELICNTYLFHSKTNELGNWVAKASTDLQKTTSYDTEKKIIFNTAIADIHWKTGDLKKMHSQLEILNGLKSINKNIKYNFVIDFENIKYLAELKKFDVLHKSIYNLFNTYPINYRPNYQMAIKLFYLLLLFLEKDYLLLKYEIKKAKYYLQKFNYDSPFSSYVIKDLNFYCKKALNENPGRGFEKPLLDNLVNYLKLPSYPEDFGIYLNFNVFV